MTNGKMAYFVIVGLMLPLLMLLSCSDSPTEVEITSRLVLDPASLEFTAPYGGPPPTPKIIAVLSNDGSALSYNFGEECSWMLLSNQAGTSFGVTPDSFVAYFSVANAADTMPVGTYSDSILVTSVAAANSPQYLAITLHIGAELSVAPQSLAFIGAAGGDDPVSQKIYIDNSTADAFSYTVESSAAWLSLAGTTGTGPESVTVNINTDGLDGGLYIDTIYVYSDDVINSPQIVICNLSLSPWLSQTAPLIPNFRDVFAVSSSEAWAAGFDASHTEARSGVVVHTVDGGSQWTFNLSIPAGRDEYYALGSVRFVGQDGWTVGENGVIRHTADGGASWQPQSTGLADTAVSLNDVYFISADSGWIVGEDGLLLKTVDGGATWVAKSSGTVNNLWSVFFIDNLRGWMVGDGGQVRVTADGGETWALQSVGSYDFRDVFFADANNGWTVGESGTVLHTANGGENWVPQTSGVSTNLNGVFFNSATRGWIVGLDGVILFTDDGGEHWTFQFSFTTKWLFAVRFADDMNGWIVGELGTILHTTSGGI